MCCYKKKDTFNLKKKGLKEPKPDMWPNNIQWPLPDNVNYSVSSKEIYPIRYNFKTPNFEYNDIWDWNAINEKKNEIKENRYRLMDFDPQFEIRNRKQLEKFMDKNSEGVIVTEKMDGHRMYWDGSEGWSRTGKTKFNIPSFWRAILTNIDDELDGELYLPGLPASQVSTLRGKTFLGFELWYNVAEYHLFDLPKSELNYSDRIKKLYEIGEKIKYLTEAICGKDSRIFIKVIPGILMKNADEVDHYFDKIMKNTHQSNFDINKDTNLLIPTIDKPSEHIAEGLVLSMPNKEYISGSSYYKVKYKAKYEKDCVVIEPHPTKASIKVYREDCEPFTAIFYLSTEGKPKEFFKEGDIIKYTCLGFSKGNDKCPALPKMPKFKDFRTEEGKDILNKSKKKQLVPKLPPPPKDGPNELFAKYLDEVGKKYFEKKQNMKGLGYRKTAAAVRRIPIKLKEKKDCKNYLGSKSYGEQCLCYIAENELNKDWMKFCAKGRLD